MDSGFLRSLHRVLYEDAVRDVDLALRVAVLSARGLPRAEIAERLGVELSDVQRAIKQLRRTLARIRES